MARMTGSGTSVQDWESNEGLQVGISEITRSREQTYLFGFQVLDGCLEVWAVFLKVPWGSGVKAAAHGSYMDLQLGLEFQEAAYRKKGGWELDGPFMDHSLFSSDSSDLKCQIQN